MDVDDFIKKMKENFKFYGFLEHVIQIPNMNEDKQLFFNKLYESDFNFMNYLASILNSCYYHKTSVFLISYRILSKIIYRDENQKNKKISTKEYTSFINFIKENQIVKAVQAQEGSKPGAYEIIYPDFLKELDLSAKHKQTVAAYVKNGFSKAEKTAISEKIYKKHFNKKLQIGDFK